MLIATLSFWVSPIYAQVSAAETAWSTKISSDPMTGESIAFARSSIIGPSTPMSFPYSDVEGWLEIRCDSDREIIYIRFKDTPNLTGTRQKNGYDLTEARIKWDDNLESIYLAQHWGSTVLKLIGSAKVIQNVLSYKSMIIELHWYGQSLSHFNFPLEGAVAALKEIRTSCKNK